MKKIFTIAAILAGTFMFAQDNDSNSNTKSEHKKIPGRNISARGMYSEPSQWGLSFEFGGSEYRWAKSSYVANVSYGTMNYETDIFDVDGQGFAIELGKKTYYSKGDELTGVYTANYLSYGNVNFDENISLGEFDGTYSYFSFFSPEVGYKMNFGGFTIDPFIGIMWKIEVKGKGDIDNKNVDEWTTRAGIKIGYSY